jgi:uncharacterized protein (DUF2235 family)
MARDLIVFCDGTWNTPAQTDRGVVVPSNVVKLSQAVDAADPAQRVYYDTGVGTQKGWDRWTGGMFGIGLTDNILQAYRWVANEYQDDDRLFFFGFSRGAYTVRSLAGLIGRCGLTAPKDDHAARHAYDLYRQAASEEGKAHAEKFKAVQRQPSVYFLGVWDTVGSLGVPALSRYGLLRKLVRRVTEGSKYAHGFHDETLGKHVLHAYQALAIDEQRGAFAPSLWKAEPTPRANVEQVWFVGVHTNIGGGYVDSGLSDIALSWMASKAAAAGLKLRHDYLAQHVRPNADGELRDSFIGVYKALPRAVREIGRSETLNEKIHKSAVARMERQANNYRPDNLTRVVTAGAPICEDGIAAASLPA